MSDGNRRKIVAAIIGLALAIGLGAVSYQLYKASEQRDTGYTYQPADEASVGVVGTSKALAKAYQPKCKNPQNDKDADLCAQWAAVEQVAEANRLTSLNAKMAIASLVATAIATFLLLWTLLGNATN
ncbi:MAG: hypothetical protein IPL18_11375 [Sphingomonadales bacterium]|nr:hypothetical protein [Sphingomonadales bacterium]